MTSMNRREMENVIEPIIRKSLRTLEFTPQDVADADFAVHTNGMFRPDVRRVSLIAEMARTALGPEASGEGLEIGSAYGYVLFPMAVLFPGIRWTGLDHPRRSYRHPEAYPPAYREYNCQFAVADLCRDPLPFPDGCFSLVTFSEVLEHLPVERVNFVLGEIARVIRPNGVWILSSPNQASAENRLRLLKGKSILAMPDETDSSKGLFGHIRLYTREEIATSVTKLGFDLEQSRMETNISGYRASAGSWKRRMYRCYEEIERRVGVLRGLGDTWYLAFRKKGVGGQV